MVRLVVASDQPAAMLADPPSAVSRRFGPRELVGFERDEVQERSAWSPRTWLPPQKIAWGVLLTLLVVTAPLGLPLLVIGLVQLRRPVWRVRVLVAEAEREPPDARALLESAYAVAPDSPLVLAAMARWHHRHLHLAAAIRFYRAYLAQAPDDWRMRAWYAAACLRHGAVDASIASFTVVVAGAGLSAEARASASAHLAYGLMCSEDLREARAVLGRVTPPSGEALSPAQRQCVYYSAVVDYLLGERDQAIATVDRTRGARSRLPGASLDRAGDACPQLPSAASRRGGAGPGGGFDRRRAGAGDAAAVRVLRGSEGGGRGALPDLSGRAHRLRDCGRRVRAGARCLTVAVRDA